MSTFTAAYPLTAELYRAGVRVRLRRVALRVLILCAIGVAAGLQLLGMDEPTWASELATAMFTICAFAMGMLLALYARLRRVESEWLKRVGGGTATLSMDDEGLGIEIPDQRTWVRWRALRELWCGREVWLFYKRGSGEAVIVSASAFDGAGAGFARAKAAEAGARVRDA